MKRTFAVLTLMFAVLLVFGCSLGGTTYYSTDAWSCEEINAKDRAQTKELERMGYTKGTCPTSYKVSKGCAYFNDSLDTTVTMYFPNYTNDEMVSWCDIADGELVN